MEVSYIRCSALYWNSSGCRSSIFAHDADPLITTGSSAVSSGCDEIDKHLDRYQAVWMFALAGKGPLCAGHTRYGGVSTLRGFR